ncbi:hypothetical protein D3C86_1964690 [compost metagenome]
MAIHIRRAVGQALGQVQFEIGETLGIEATTEAVDGRLTDISHLGQGGNTGVDGGLGRCQNHLRYLTL